MRSNCTPAKVGGEIPRGALDRPVEEEKEAEGGDGFERLPMEIAENKGGFAETHLEKKVVLLSILFMSHVQDSNGFSGEFRLTITFDLKNSGWFNPAKLNSHNTFSCGQPL
jgi:hypothetical protein